MKINLLLATLLLNVIVLKAQYVTIPDTNFVSWLQTNVPSAMIGNQMDTTSTAVLNMPELSIQNNPVIDLSGIQYFKNLVRLSCNFDSIQILPPLPNSIKTLQCSFNPNLDSITEFPDSLEQLSCSHNNLSSLPPFPNGLFSIDCGKNLLTSLPQLPDSLRDLDCYSNLLTSLPALPASIKIIQAFENHLTILPVLRNSLTLLDIRENQLTDLPTLPDSLRILMCSYNFLTSIPPLPNKLNHLHCTNNLITGLPDLPANLEALECDSNFITCLPILPEYLVYSESFPNGSSINGNPITCLPNYTLGMTPTELAFPLCLINDTIHNPHGCAGDPNNAVNSIEKEKLLYVFPLPFNYEFIIEGDFSDTPVSIVDIYGREIIHAKMYDNRNPINTENWKAGIYFLRIIDENGIAVKKLIKE